MSEGRQRRLTEAQLDEAERLEMIGAVEESLADPRPSIPHEVVAAEMDARMEALERKIASLLPPVA